MAVVMEISQDWLTGKRYLMPVLGTLHPQTSASNQLRGQVSRLHHGAVNSDVIIGLGE